MKSPIHIQPCQSEACLEQVEELAQAIWKEHYTPLIGAEQVDYMLKKFQSKEVMLEQIQGGYRYFQVVLGDLPIGYFSYSLEPDALFLSKYYMQGTQRGKGYGRMCMNHIEQLCLAHEKRAIRLTVNKGNAETIALYQHMGFRIKEDVVLDIGGGFVMDDHVLEKQLRS